MGKLGNDVRLFATDVYANLESRDTIVRDPKPGFLDEPVIISYTLQTSFFKYFNVLG